jgi:AraC-like DNA-binding protein
MRRPTPLASFSVLRTTDVDEARSRVGASLAPHRLSPVGTSGFRATHNVAQVGRLSLHYIDYATEVEVAVAPLDFVLVEIPLAGVTTISAGKRRLVATSDTAVISGWGEGHRRHFSAGNPRLMVRVDAGFFGERAAVATRTGMELPREFGARLELDRGRGRSWRCFLDTMIGDVERGAGLMAEGLAASSWQSALVDGLIACLAQRSEEPSIEPCASMPVISKAARLIEDHCAEPIGTPDIAEAVGLSVRSLQEGFRRHLDTTPMAYLRQARLRRVRESLMDGSALSVTEAGTRWGLAHLGRLSTEYRAAFGESPSETLHRSR